MIRALIVDDEAAARALLRSLLQGSPDLDVIGECANGQEAVAAIQRHRPDLVFLDIQMPGMDGFEVIEALERDALPGIIFVTAHDEHALRAFDVQALDYLLKPFDRQRFEETLARARRRMSEGLGELPDRLAELVRAATGRRGAARIAVRDRDETVILRADEIDWIESEANYVSVHAAGQAYLARATLRSLEERLDPERFVRIHRGTIVNVDRVRRMTALGHGDQLLTLADGTELQMSRRFRDRLEKVLQQL